MKSSTDRLAIICGTPNYIAPEVLHANRYFGYSYPADVWSFEIIMYIMLFGKPPFYSNDVNEIT